MISIKFYCENVSKHRTNQFRFCIQFGCIFKIIIWVFVGDCYMKTFRLATILNTVDVTRQQRLRSTAMIYYAITRITVCLFQHQIKNDINSWLREKMYSFNIPTTLSIPNIRRSTNYVNLKLLEIHSFISSPTEYKNWLQKHRHWHEHQCTSGTGEHSIRQAGFWLQSTI